MNAGIIINGSQRKGRLTLFHCTIWPQMETVMNMSESAEVALRRAGVPDNVQWISGTAATKTLARKLGLKFRLRAPGAGRHAISPNEKVKRVTVWIEPALIPEFKALTKRFKKENHQK